MATTGFPSFGWTVWKHLIVWEMVWYDRTAMHGDTCVWLVSTNGHSTIYRRGNDDYYGWFIISSEPLYKGLLQKSEDFKIITRQQMLFLYYYKFKIWCYWFQSKRISIPWTVSTKHVIFWSRSVWTGLRCNKLIASKDLVIDKRRSTTIDGNQNQDHFRPMTKLDNVSVSRPCLQLCKLASCYYFVQFQVLKNVFVEMYIHVLCNNSIWY